MKHTMSHVWCKIVISVLLVALIVMVVDYTFHEHFDSDCVASFNFVNADAACGDKPVIAKIGYAALRGRLEDYIAVQKREQRVSEVAIYFRDLELGPVMGINEINDFAPASLLKLPLAILYLSYEDATPGFLKRQPKLQYTLPPESYMNDPARPISALNLGQAFPPPEEIVSGQPYEIEELLFRLLAYSDNRANELLGQHVLNALGGEDAFVQIYRELGMIDSESLGDETITVRSYSSIFRLLYNVSYLNPELSEKILEWLSRSSFKEGLVAGVPSNVRVAHKFGERELADEGVQQLHDCGIIYYPENPYLLCVMTKGENVMELASVIADISRFFYEEFDSRRLDK